jgi:hypothetical protein
VPDSAAQQTAQKLIREVLGKQYDSAATKVERTAMAKRALELAMKTENDPAGKFRLLVIARDAAVSAAHIDLAVRAVEELTAAFQLDRCDALLEAFEDLQKTVQPPSENGLLAVKAIACLDTMLDAEEYDPAGRLASIAQSAASKSRDKQIVDRSRERAEAIRDLARLSAAAKRAMPVLQENPTDATANQSVGQYQCFVKRDWEKGIPMLALGNDVGLAELGKRELKDAATPDDQVGLGDGWWERAQDESGRVREAMLSRAGSWYERAKGGLTGGLTMAKVEKRLAEIQDLKIKPVPIESVDKLTPSTLAGTPTVDVARRKPVPFVADHQEEIPGLSKGSVTFMMESPRSGDVSNGVLEFTVHRSGLVYLAAQWKYEGNRSGGWYEERLSKEQLVEKGWEDTGPAPWDSSIVIFRKMVKEGESYRIRTNKYGAPLLIIPLPGTSPTAERAAPIIRHEDFARATVTAKFAGLPEIEGKQAARIKVDSQFQRLSLKEQTDDGKSLSAVLSRQYAATESVPYLGKRQFEVLTDGVVLALVYQKDWGDLRLSGGEWRSEVQSREQLSKLGWRELGDVQSGELLLLYRECKAGERLCLQTKKYATPLIVVPLAAVPRDRLR